MKDKDSREQELAFDEMVGRNEEEIDLAAAALLIARKGYPDLNVGRYVARLKDMAEAISYRLEDPKDPLGVVRAINGFLFDGEGFEGNETDYYDPRNSFLNDVLDRKKGIPITLSIIYMEMGRRIGFPIYGVGFPQHFLVKYQTPEEQIIIDPFNRGLILTQEDCANRLRLTSGGRLEFKEHYLAGLTNKQILRRVLTNLKAIYLSTSNYPKALSFIDMLLDLIPWDMDEIRDRGKVYYHLKEYHKALADLEIYLQFSPDAHDAELIGRNIERLKQLASKPGSCGVSSQ